MGRGAIPAALALVALCPSCRAPTRAPATPPGATTTESRADRARPDPDAATREPASVPACGGRFVTPGATWRELNDRSYEPRLDGDCQGAVKDWILGQPEVVKKVLAVRDGRVTRLKVTTRAFEPLPGSYVERSFLVDLDRPRTDGFAGPRVESLDGAEIGALLRETHALDRVVPDVAWPHLRATLRRDERVPELAPAIEQTFQLERDDGPRMSVRWRGYAARPFGRVRAFSVRGRVEQRSAGLSHAWRTQFDVTGTVYLAADEDVLIEAAIDMEIVGQDHGATCARGRGTIRFRIDCPGGAEAISADAPASPAPESERRAR